MEGAFTSRKIERTHLKNGPLAKMAPCWYNNFEILFKILTMHCRSSNLVKKPENRWLGEHSHKEVGVDERTTLSTRIVCAALCIPHKYNKNLHLYNLKNSGGARLIWMRCTRRQSTIYDACWKRRRSVRITILFY